MAAEEPELPPAPPAHVPPPAPQAHEDRVERETVSPATVAPPPADLLFDFPPPPAMEPAPAARVETEPPPASTGTQGAVDAVVETPVPVETALPPPELTDRPELPPHVGEHGTSLLESILRPSQASLKTTSRPTGSTISPKATPPPSEPLHQPLRPLADEPLPTDPTGLGMGEILEDHFTQPSVSGVIRHRAPGLGIDLIQMEDSPESERRVRRGRLAFRGVVIFLIVDLCVAAYYGIEKLRKWWTTEPAVIHRAVPVQVEQPADKDEPPLTEDTKKEQAPSTKPPEASGDKTISEAPPQLPPVSQLVPQQNPWSVAGASIQTGLSPQVPVSPGPAMPAASQASPGPAETKPSADAEAPLPTGPTPSAAGKAPLPADVPTSPPLPPPPPGAMPATTSAGVIKAIPLDELTPPATEPREAAPKPREMPPAGELPSDQAQAMLVGKVGADQNPLSATTMPLTNEPLPESASAPAPEEARSAVKAAKAFLNADTWTDRLKWSQRADAIRREMESYYAKHPAGPLRFSSLEFMQRFPAKNGLPAYCMFEVKGPDFPHPVLLLVDQPSNKDGQVDWEAFVEFQSDALAKFFAARSSEATRFRVVMRRRHAFEKDVPDVETKDSFEVSHPGAGETFPVYVARKSSIGRELENKLPWNSDLPAIVELYWRKQGAQHWVEVRTVAAYGWKR